MMSNRTLHRANRLAYGMKSSAKQECDDTTSWAYCCYSAVAVCAQTHCKMRIAANTSVALC
jgi:hypothetical protein